MRAALIIGLIFITGLVKGQFPFEKYPEITYKKYKDWISYDRINKEHKLHHTLTISRFFNDSASITIQLTLFDTLDYSIIRIFKDKKEIQKFIEPSSFYGLTSPYPIFTADYNKDSLLDLKFLIPNHGCGAFNNYSRVIYLLQNKFEKFSKISYTDNFIELHENRLERDFDGDGRFEIITQTFQNYLNHNYWLFNIYDFNNDTLVNVNNKDNYPIMIQLLRRDNFEITDKISKEKQKHFERKLPDDYIKK